MTPDDDDEDAYPHTVRVPIRSLGPFGAEEMIEVPVENAGQWDVRVWQDHP